MRLASVLLLALACLLPGRSVRADELEIPGLRADSAAYARSLRQRFPAGATARQQADAEARAQAAEARRDWAAAALAWSDRAGGGDAPADAWLSLSRDLFRQPRPDPAHALAAAWQAFAAAEAGADEVPALLAMRDALAALGRPVPEVEALEAAADRAPDDAELHRQLATRKQQLGLLVRGVRTEPESFPARACVRFIGRPGGSADFHAADWVQLDPKRPDASVTLESGELCIAGLPPGATTRVGLLAGMPGVDGVSLKAPETLAVAMPDRRPRLVFDGARFLQPRGAPAEVTLASVNLSAVKLALVRVTERAAQPFLAAHPAGDEVADADLDGLRQSGELAWQGQADIPAFARNALLRTRLPLPGAALDRPGLYILLATPGDGTPASGDAPQAVQMVLRTDLAPTTWQGADGLGVQVRAYANAQPTPGVQVALIAADNDVLATETTGPDGTARFASALLHGTAGAAPAALHLSGPDGNDFTVLNLTRPAFDLSDRGVSGQAQPGPLDAFVWLDRGIYRPGETVHATALLRDAAGRPADVPVHVVVKRPGGQVFADLVPKRGEGASLSVPIALSGGAQAGTWTVELHATKDGPEVGHAAFRVDAFVPARLAVELAPAAPLLPGQVAQLPVSVRFLYGAPGAGLSGDGRVRIEADPAPFADFAGYGFGLEGEAVPGDPSTPDLAETDAGGNTVLPLDLTRLPDVTGALRAQVTATINDPAGRPVSASATVPIRPAGPLIGIRAAAGGGAVDPGGDAAFDVIALDPQGARIAMAARMTLVRQVPDWRLVVRRGMASYETVWRDEPVDSGAAAIPAGGAPLRLSWRLGFGRYKLQVVQAGQGLAAASHVFTAGWSDGGDPDVPARVRVSADRARYSPGDTARVHVEAPFAGPAALLVLTDRVHLIRNLELPDGASGGLDVDVPVGADWGAGAYVAVHAYRPANGVASDRAIGVAWLQVDPAARSLPVAVEAPPVLRPRSKATVAVRTAPGAWLTLAAVDEGVLRLTGFATPDPVAHFLGKRALGVDIRDEWGRLLRPADGTLTELREGGGSDSEGEPPPPPPQRVVALFAPPIQAGPDGVAQVPLDLPDFNGQLHLMAVAWSGDKVGGADADVFVRDPLVAEALLPRFLAPGDTARLGVLLQNVELPPGPVRVRITASGAVALAGADAVQATLGSGEKAVEATTLRAGDAGEGRIVLDVAGPGGFFAHHEISLPVHSARGRVVAVAGAEVAPGAEAGVAPDAAGAFVPGTWTASLSLGGAVRYGVAGLVQALADYPLSCLEQVASRGLPLAMLPDGTAAGADRAGRLETAVEQALDRQRYDGAFGLWSSEGEAQAWLTAYAADFLLRAKQAGAAVPQLALDRALAWLADEVTRPPGDAEGRAAQAYAVYVLARAGRAPAGAIRVMAASEEELPTPLARAQLAASLARIAQPDAAAALLRASFAAPGRKAWFGDYGSALRDQLATAVLVKESGTNAVAAPALAAALPGADLEPRALNTQEQAWAAAAAAVLGAGTPPVSARVDGRDLPRAPLVTLPLAGTVRVRNTGAAPLWESVSVSGVPSVAPPASRNLMQVRRHFFDQQGGAVNSDKLPQNTVFVLLLEGGAEDGQQHQAMLRAGLPAGWEVAGRLPEGRVPGMDWLGELTAVNTEAAADDRFAAAFDLTAAKPGFRLAVLLRAVTPGEYEYPGTELADMYRPAVYARQGAVRVSVLPAP